MIRLYSRPLELTVRSKPDRLISALRDNVPKPYRLIVIPHGLLIQAPYRFMFPTSMSPRELFIRVDELSDHLRLRCHFRLRQGSGVFNFVIQAAFFTVFAAFIPKYFVAIEHGKATPGLLWSPAFILVVLLMFWFFIYGPIIIGRQEVVMRGFLNRAISGLDGMN